MHLRSKLITDGGIQIPSGADVGSVLMATDTSGNGKWDPLVLPGFLDILGHSHAADYLATQPDFGMAHKIDGLLQPATFRSTALGGAVHSWHDQGNGTSGDGGWAHQLPEFPRNEEIDGFGNIGQTTMTGATAAGANVALPVTDRTGFYSLEYVVVGQGANTEICQVVSSYAGATGAGNVTVASCANAHASGDPVYASMTNVGGYPAKSSLVLIGTGVNDLPVLGPFAQGTFGTTPGASRGLVPLQHAIRFTLSQLRCSVIYRDTHPACIYAGTWVSQAEGGLYYASAPPITRMGIPSQGIPGNLHYSQTGGSSVSFSTAPDFPGGTVVFFTMSGNDASGAIWNLTVTGATTRTIASALDSSSRNSVSFANANTSGMYTGVVYRITGLNPGVNVITMTIGTLGTTAWFLGWGIEAPQPPKIDFLLDPRVPTLTAYGSRPYYTRTPATTQTATVGAGAGTAANSVTLGTAVTVGTTGTTQTAVYPGDTITIGTGATAETRRIAGVDSTTTLHVDANFVNAHTGAACVIGLQNADIVGGGYENPADTQGKTSVPGVQAAIKSVIAEFDQWVTAFDTDVPLNGGPNNAVKAASFAADGLHYSNVGHGLLAASYYKSLLTAPWTIDSVASATIPNKRTWILVYGENYPAGEPTPDPARTQFANGWTNMFPLNNSYARTSYYKDMRTRTVYVRGAVVNSAITSDALLPSVMFALPTGYRPEGIALIPAYSAYGPAVVEVDNAGAVWCTAGNVGGGVLEFSGSFLADH